MAEIVNLRIARKRRKNAKAEIAAAANRVAFGVSKDVRDRAERERSLTKTRLEAHKRIKPRDND
jgi:hypothetical protein